MFFFFCLLSFSLFFQNNNHIYEEPNLNMDHQQSGMNYGQMDMIHSYSGSGIPPYLRNQYYVQQQPPTLPPPNQNGHPANISHYNQIMSQNQNSGQNIPHYNQPIGMSSNYNQMVYNQPNMLGHHVSSPPPFNQRIGSPPPTGSYQGMMSPPPAGYSSRMSSPPPSAAASFFAR